MTEQRERRAWGTGRIFKRKRSRFWYIRYYDAEGKRRTEATRTTSKAKAEGILRQRLSAKDRGELIPDAHRVTFADLEQLILDDYAVRGRRSTKRLKIALDHLRAAFGGWRALAITSDRVRAYERDRLDAGAARSTVNAELAALRRAFNLAYEHGRLPQRPVIKTPQPDNARRGFFEEEELDAVLREMPAYWRAPLRFAFLTGWRVRSEVLPLTWRQVDLDAGVVRLEPGTTKNRRGRTFPFDAFPELAALLREQRERTRALEKARGVIVPWVFHRNGKRLTTYKNSWTRACERAATVERDGVRVMVRPELLGRYVHDLRRTAVRNLERAGVPRSQAMELTGHKTEAVYRRYAIVSEADLREAVAKRARLGRAAAREA